MRVTATPDERGRPAPDEPPVDPAPEPGDTFIELRDGVPYIGTEPAVKAALVDVTDFLTTAVTGAFNPKELRDPHTGKWIRDPAGKYLDHALPELGKGQMLSHAGHEVDRSAKGYNVRFYRREGGRKVKTGEARTYESHLDAAEALRRGAHVEPGAGKPKLVKAPDVHRKDKSPEPEPEPPKPAKPSRQEEALAAVDRNLERFNGNLSRPIGDATSMKLYAENVDRLGAKLSGQRRADWNADKGVQFTKFALDSKSHATGTRVIVAKDVNGGVAGAISYYVHREEGFPPFIHVDYLGTTGSAAGAGTTLAHQVAKIAAARNMGVMGEPENEGALTFWTKIGWHPDPLDLGASTFAGWTPEETKAVAARG